MATEAFVNNKISTNTYPDPANITYRSSTSANAILSYITPGTYTVNIPSSAQKIKVTTVGGGGGGYHAYTTTYYGGGGGISYSRAPGKGKCGGVNVYRDSGYWGVGGGSWGNGGGLNSERQYVAPGIGGGGPHAQYAGGLDPTGGDGAVFINY